MHWKHKYFEKNSKELHTNIFRSLEIEQYLKQVLKNKGFNLHNYKLNFSNDTFSIFLSVYKSNKKNVSDYKKLQLIKKNVSLKKRKFISKLEIKIKKYAINKNFFRKSYNKMIYIKVLKFYKDCHLTLLKNNKLKTAKFSDLSKRILESLKLYMGSNFNITLTINEISFIYFKVKEEEKKVLISFRKFKRTPFFKEGNQLLVPLITQRNSAKLLGTFITTQLGTIKRHNFFFNFLKESLFLVVDQKFSKIKGIKILIKGRLNNAARSQRRLIKIGKIPLITINSKIDYSESTAFTSNGTLGVKVWVCAKNKNTLNVFTTKKNKI